MSNNLENENLQLRWLRILANIVSYIFHPVFMPTIMALVLYKLSPVSFAGITFHDFGRWLAIIIVNTLFFPLLLVALLKGLGFLESIQMKNAKDRIIPLVGIMIFYFWAAHVFDNLVGVPLILRALLLGSFWGVIAVFMLNIFYKVSLHTAGAGSMVGIMFVLLLVSPVNMLFPFFIAIIIAGVIGTARMILGAHKPIDIWLGYIFGVLVQVGAYWYLK